MKEGQATIRGEGCLSSCATAATGGVGMLQSPHKRPAKNLAPVNMAEPLAIALTTPNDCGLMAETMPAVRLAHVPVWRRDEGRPRPQTWSILFSIRAIVEPFELDAHIGVGIQQARVWMVVAEVVERVSTTSPSLMSWARSFMPRS